MENLLTNQTIKKKTNKLFYRRNLLFRIHASQFKSFIGKISSLHPMIRNLTKFFVGKLCLTI